MEVKREKIITVEELLARVSDEFYSITDADHNAKDLNNKINKAETAKNLANTLFKWTSLQLKAAEAGGQNDVTMLDIPAGQIQPKKENNINRLLN
jgi:hypothetical protein